MWTDRDELRAAYIEWKHTEKEQQRQRLSLASLHFYKSILCFVDIYYLCLIWTNESSWLEHKFQYSESFLKLILLSVHIKLINKWKRKNCHLWHYYGFMEMMMEKAFTVVQ